MRPMRESKTVGLSVFRPLTATVGGSRKELPGWRVLLPQIGPHRPCEDGVIWRRFPPRSDPVATAAVASVCGNQISGSGMFARLLLIISFVLLAACDSAEERAEKHFQDGLALYEEGDVARAIVEMRNVFRIDSTHREGRLLMARIEMERDNPPGAYGHYRALTEQFPDDFEAQRAAAELAAELNDWDAASMHAKAAAEQLAEGETDPVIRSVELGAAYRAARQENDLPAAREIAEEAGELLQDNPDIVMLRRIRVDDRFAAQDWEGALTEIDGVIAATPDDQSFYLLRLTALDQLGRSDEIEAQLRDMVDRFPEDDIRRVLVTWYMEQDRASDAEAYLREQIDPENPDAIDRMVLVTFLSQLRGAEAARAEIDTILADTPDDSPDRPLFRSVAASLDFDLGNRDAALAEMQDIIAGSEPSDQTRRIKITYAKMLDSTGNSVGARALVEEVLEEDSSNVEALKMRANWMIADDSPDEALVELRRALDQAPRDAEVLTLMAQAQERLGSHELSGEMLALAVEASGAAAEESLRYATFLVQDDRLLPAESVLIDALRLQPENHMILAALGSVYVQLEDWGRAQGVIDALQRLDSEEAARVANELTGQVLAGQNRQSELQSFLEQLAGAQGTDGQAIAAAIRLRVAQGDLDGAMEYLNERLAENPDNPGLRLISAALLSREDRHDEARTTLRELLQEFPDNQQLWMALYNVNLAAGEPEAAEEVLQEGLQEVPDGVVLRFTSAVEAERNGEIESAIAVYESLYESNSGSLVVANNLASLISSYREDDESLQRAYAIARRLRGSEIPQFQDTYGWIAARLGNIDEALEYLESSAEGLQDDATAQYHLARTYVMAGREEDALEVYRRTLTILDTNRRQLPFREEVVAEISRLEAAEPSVDN